MDPPASHFDPTSAFRRAPEPWDLRWLLKIALGVVIAPVRLLLVAIIVLACDLLARLATYGIHDNLDTELPKHHNAWRRRLLLLQKHFSRVLLLVLGVSLHVTGDPASDADGNVLTVVANHSSWLDSIVLSAIFACNFVAKAEMRSAPIVGHMMATMQCIFVDRDKGGTAALEAIQLRQQQPAAGYRPLAIYPEGTTSNGQQLIAFKHGAFAQGVPVQPVHISYAANKHFSPTWANVQLKTPIHIILLACQRHTRVDVTILDLYRPSQDEQDDVSLFASNVRDRLANAAPNGPLPTTEHTFRHKINWKTSLRSKAKAHTPAKKEL